MYDANLPYRKIWITGSFLFEKSGKYIHDAFMVGSWETKSYGSQINPNSKYELSENHYRINAISMHTSASTISIVEDDLFVT